jgi:hypothetical protein
MATWEEIHYNGYVKSPHGWGRVVGWLKMDGKPARVLIALSSFRYGHHSSTGVQYLEHYAVEDVEVVEG